MARPNTADYIQLWAAALDHELGLMIEVNNPKLFRNYLYEARQISDDPRFQDLIVFIPASADRVFLVRKSVELEP